MKQFGACTLTLTFLFDITIAAYINMHVKTTFIMEADSMNPDQTTPNLGSYATKVHVLQ